MMEIYYFCGDDGKKYCVTEIDEEFLDMEHDTIDYLNNKYGQRYTSQIIIEDGQRYLVIKINKEEILIPLSYF